MIGLILIGQPLEINNELVQLHPVRSLVIDQRKISVLARIGWMRRADIAREIYPAINLDFAPLPSVAAWSVVDRLHQRIGRKFARIADDRASANLPIA